MTLLTDLRNRELKAILSQKNLSTAGNKAEMVQRLTEFLGTNEIEPDQIPRDEQEDALQKQIDDLKALVVSLTTTLQNNQTSAIANNVPTPHDPTQDDDSVSQQQRRLSHSSTIVSVNNSIHSQSISSADTPFENNNAGRNRFSVKEVAESIPEYDPTNDKSISAEQFVQHIESAVDAYGFDDKTLLLAIYSRLKNVARMWLDGRKVLFTSWCEFKTALLEEFGQELNEAEISAKMLQNVRRPDEKPIDYSFRMLALGNRLGLSEPAMVQYTRNGLRHRELQNALAATRFNTMKSMRQAISEYEQNMPNTSKCRGDLSEMKSNGSRTLTKDNIKQENNVKPVVCYNCNEKGHISKNCPKPQKKERCTICQKTNHKTKDCSNGKPNVNKIDDDGKSKIVKDIVVNGINFKGFVDPGSSRTLIKSSLAYTLAQTTPCQISLKGFAGGVYECVEQVKLTLKIDNGTFETTMLLVDDKLLTEDVLIGRDVVCQNGHRLIIENGNCHVQHTTEANSIETNEDPNLKNLIERYQDVFANQVSELGICSKVKMKIELTSTTPIQLKPYRIPFAKRVIVNKIVAELLEHQIIRPSQSDFASPTVLVTKKNGEPRLCVDYRMLNKITKKIPFPMPLIEEQFAQLAGNKFYSTLDLRMGYHQVEICEDSKKYTAFITNDGHFEYNRMPFGLVNAPGVFQELMNQLSARMQPGELLTYLDDVIIPSQTREQGLERLEKVFLLLREFGLTLRKDKCKFLVNEIQHLGYHINEQNISPGECKVAAIKEFRIPTNQTEVRRFLGLTGFFRKFVPYYALISSPLTQLLKKECKQFEWGEKQQLSFATLIEKLTHAPTLQLYDVNAQHEVHTDACITGLAGMLLQSSDGKNWNSVCYYSRRCTDYESKCHSYELEVLAIVETLERFRIYLLGKQFTIVTDCAAIATMKQQKELKPKVARWWLKLLEYDFNIKHRPGSKLAHVDAMSRAPVENAVKSTEAGIVYNISERYDDWLFLLQMKDDTLKQIHDELTGKAKSPQTKQIKTDYELCEHRIYRKTQDGNKFVVPKAIRWRVVEFNHDRMGHPSLNKTLERIKKTFWFPRMTKLVKEYISACIECCYNKSRGGMIEGELHLVEIDPIPFVSIHIDHLGPFIRSKRGNTHIIAISDAFTKYLVVKAVRNTKTTPVIGVLNELTSYFGLPTKITTDRGTAFTSKMFEDYCNNNFIRHIKNAVKTPRANGQVERANRMILEYLRSTTSNPKDWDSHLRELQWTINTQRNSTTGYTPNQLLLDFNPRDIIKNALTAALEPQEPYDDASITVKRQQALKNMNCAREKWKQRFDKAHAQPSVYKKDDLVVIHNEPPSTGESRKLEPRFKGPYQITRVLDNDRYLVESIPGTSHGNRKFCSVFATDKIKPWCSNVPEMVDTYDSTFEDEVICQEGPNCNTTEKKKLKI